MALTPGFDVDEARALLEITQKTYDNTPGETTSATKCLPPVPPPPEEWTLDTDLTPTEATLLDNFWQVWRNGKTGQVAIAVRGTVETAESIFEDVFLPLLKARMSLSLSACGIDHTLDLDFARDEGDSAVVAGVHAGFTLGLILMLLTTDRPLAATLGVLELEGADVFVAGHSQGASVATLLTSFIRHSKLYSKLATKTYVFAQAKPGNDHYAYDYDQIVGVPGLGYTLVSSQDWVPQVPLTLEWFQAVNTPNPLCRFEPGVTCKPLGELPAPLAGVAGVVKDVNAAIGALNGRFETRIKKLRGRLGEATFKLPAARLGAKSNEIVGESCVSSLLDQLEGLVLPSLDYTAAGTLVPLFATPGSNPCDNGQFDFFWQHHLGNYLKYLDAQYGG